MKLVEIDEGLAINVDKIVVIKVVEDSDKFEDPHVLIDFGSSYLELDPEVSMEQVCSAIDRARSTD